MDHSNNHNPLLDLLNRPAFLVRDGIITQVNQAAQQKLICVGARVSDILGDHLSIYEAFQNGSLYLSLQLDGGSCGATVTVAEDQHLFCLEQNEQVDQALALAAQQLRSPLHSLFSAVEAQPELQSVQQSLYQLQRIITNMSDFPRYQDQGDARMEVTDFCRVFAEVVEKASVLLDCAGVRLNYTALPEYVIGLADREMLERAVYNLISNAAKFSPKGSTVEAKLTHSGNMLYFTVQDQGDGIPFNVLNNVFNRYLRAPGIEDGRHGVGLGLALVRSAAVCHKGTVLIDQPETGGTRITMTVTVTPSDDTILRSPIRIPFSDYAGGRDHGLLELSDILPGDAYKNI